MKSQTTAVSRCLCPLAEGWGTWVTRAGSEWEGSWLSCPQENLPLVVAGIAMEARPPSDF